MARAPALQEERVSQHHETPTSEVLRPQKQARAAWVPGQGSRAAGHTRYSVALGGHSTEFPALHHALLHEQGPGLAETPRGHRHREHP